jgi:lysophospholipase L1-like esterase
MTGESVVLAGTQPTRLLSPNLREGTVAVRSTYLPTTTGSTTYENRRDYTLDLKNGTVARTPNSRIPDYSANVLFNQKDFDHSRHPGYGNGRFTVYVDYATESPVTLTHPVAYSSRLQKTLSKLHATSQPTSRPFKIIAFGDSITAGGEASSPDLQYPARYADYLRHRLPRAQITFENGATGGDTTRDGLQRLDEKVLSRSPDLVLVAFGMNDHNIPGFGVPLPEFQSNLTQIVTQIRDKTGADVILLSAFPPNPDWHFGSHSMAQYAAATKQVADQLQVPYADVYATWSRVLERKDAPSLLGNNINHPNDFGHWLYLEALKAVQF